MSNLKVLMAINIVNLSGKQLPISAYGRTSELYFAFDNAFFLMTNHDGNIVELTKTSGRSLVTKD